jgi:hypothetical protein
VRKQLHLAAERKPRAASLNDKFSFGAASSLAFVGNRLASTLDLAQPDGKTLRQKYLIGDPQPCPAGSAEEMTRRGFVGVYSKQTEPLYRLPGSQRTLRQKG